MKRIAQYTVLIISILFCCGVAMAEGDVMGFGMTAHTTINTADFIGLEGNKFSLVFRGRTGGDGAPMMGIGIFEGNITIQDRRTMLNMRNAVCSMKPEDIAVHPGNPAFFFASVTCPDGREVPGMVDIPSLPSAVGKEVLSPTSDLIEKFYKTGTPVARLEAVGVVAPENGKLLFSFMFKNDGEQEIAFKSPATWEGTWNPISKDSNIDIGGGPIDDDDDYFSVKLGRENFLNASDYPDDIVRIPAHSMRIFKFLALPNNRILKGKYKIGATITIREMLAPERLRGPVEFSIPFIYTEFDKPFPSNDTDLQRVEARRRELLFQQIKATGKTVAETAYYRAYGMSSKDRDDFPQLLHKGDRYPERPMKRLDGNKTLDIGPAEMWRWEAFPDAEVRAASGQPCPRAGIWLPTHGSGANTDPFRTNEPAGGARAMETGQPFPRLEYESGQITWIWIGPLSNG